MQPGDGSGTPAPGGSMQPSPSDGAEAIPKAARSPAARKLLPEAAQIPAHGSTPEGSTDPAGTEATPKAARSPAARELLPAARAQRQKCYS